MRIKQKYSKNKTVKRYFQNKGKLKKNHSEEIQIFNKNRSLMTKECFERNFP